LERFGFDSWGKYSAPEYLLVFSGLGTSKHKIWDVFLAQAIASKTPLWMHYALIVFGVFCLIIGVVRIVSV
jgi:hypothetical protein